MKDWVKLALIYTPIVIMGSVAVYVTLVILGLLAGRVAEIYGAIAGWAFFILAVWALVALALTENK